jgi:hypothetical protein
MDLLELSLLKKGIIKVVFSNMKVTLFVMFTERKIKLFVNKDIF